MATLSSCLFYNKSEQETTLNMKQAIINNMARARLIRGFPSSNFAGRYEFSDHFSLSKKFKQPPQVKLVCLENGVDRTQINTRKPHHYFNLNNTPVGPIKLNK